jgi:hypothetical protein
VIEVAVGEAGARIRMRPAIASSRALSELLFLLADLRPRRFVLTHFQRTWQEELVPGFSPLTRRIEELVHGVRSRHPEKLFHAEERPIDPDQSLIPGPFARLLHEWAQRGGRLPPDATTPFAAPGCLGRTTLVRNRGGSDGGRVPRPAPHPLRLGRVDGYVGSMTSSRTCALDGRQRHIRRGASAAPPITQACEGTIAAPTGSAAAASTSA